MDVEDRLNKSEHLEKTYQNAYATDRRALSSLAPRQLAFDYQAIGAV